MFTNVFKVNAFLKNVLYFVNVFLNFQLVKITEITFPDSSNIGNVLTIKDNGN